MADRGRRRSGVRTRGRDARRPGSGSIEDELGDAGHRLRGEVVDDRVEMPRRGEDLQLAVRAGALVRDDLDVLDLPARAEGVDDVVDEFQELDRELLHWHLGLLAEVDEARGHAPAHRAPLVLLDELRDVAAEAEVAVAEHEQLRADRLRERRDAERLLDLCRRVAHAELDRRVERVRPQVPPDLLAIVDALRAHEQLDVVLVLVPRGELGRDPGAREALPDDLAVRLEARAAREPERTRAREREEMRQEVARLVHDLEAPLPVRDPDVDVQAEDEELADDVLQLLLEHLVAVVLGHLLLLPVGERMRARGDEAQSLGTQEGRQRAAQLEDLLARLGDVGADLRADLDDRLHHLALHALAEARRRHGEERLDVALQLAVAIDDLELLLDPDGETRHLGGHDVALAPLIASIIPRCRLSCRAYTSTHESGGPYDSVGSIQGTRAGSIRASTSRSSSRSD